MHGFSHMGSLRPRLSTFFTIRMGCSSGHGVMSTPCEFVDKVGNQGLKLPTPPPEQCGLELREMIVECFADDPSRRPAFKHIAAI